METTLLTTDDHLADEVLERYAFNRLSRVDTETVEAHLLVCDACQNRLLEIDEYILLMKVATADYQFNRATHVPSASRTAWARVRSSLVRPGLVTATAWATALAAVFIMTLAPWRVDTVSGTSAVQLVALRGGEGTAMNQAAAGKPLNLLIDLADRPAASSYRMEVVTGTGDRAWEGLPQKVIGGLSAHVAKRLRAGVYWVRLYSGEELVREFGLRLD